jgi:2-hydroxychromene-2-carboxylate isomerase
MSTHIDYYLAANSPWSYLGHERFCAMAKAAGAHIDLWPVDLGNTVFPRSGGLPLAKRAPQRQAYRLVELKRFSEFLGMPMNIQPKFFPVSPDDAARLIIAVDQQDGTEAALALTGAVLRAVWVEERNIADATELGAMLDTLRLPARRLEESRSPAVRERYEADSQRAVASGIFGAPSFVVDGEMFWGQDRLDFVERKLQG